jgi:hypothetical protein
MCCVTALSIIFFMNKISKEKKIGSDQEWARKKRTRTRTLRSISSSSTSFCTSALDTCYTATARDLQKIETCASKEAEKFAASFGAAFRLLLISADCSRFVPVRV